MSRRSPAIGSTRLNRNRLKAEKLIDSRVLEQLIRVQSDAGCSGPLAAALPGLRLLLCCCHQRASALVQRPERLVDGDGRQELVVVPRPLRLFGLLHLEQIHVMGLAAIGADLALAEERI